MTTTADGGRTSLAELASVQSGKTVVSMIVRGMRWLAGPRASLGNGLRQRIARLLSANANFAALAFAAPEPEGKANKPRA